MPVAVVERRKGSSVCPEWAETTQSNADPEQTARESGIEPKPETGLEPVTNG